MKILKSASILLVFIILFFITDFDYIIHSKLNSVKNDIKGVDGLNLNNYKVEIEAKKIKEIKKNLSGITYNKNTDTLFAITNSPRDIYELTLQGDVLRVIDLKGFKDTEGIVYLNKNLYAIVDERKARVSLIKIDEKTKKIGKKDTIHILSLNINSYKNFGYEGIAYYNEKDTLFIVNEKFPMQLIKVTNFLGNKNLDISFENGLTTFNHFMNDYSGLHFDTNSKHLLFLSDESKLISEVSLDGTQVSFAKLKKGFLGLKKDIPQAEGITMDEEGILYLVSEPNLFYSFKAN